MTATTTRRNLLRRAKNLVVVDDGSERWVSSQSKVYGWLRRHGVDRGFDRRTNLSNTARMDAETYQAFCDETPYIAATGSGGGSYAGDPYKLIEDLYDRDAVTLHIA